MRRRACDHPPRTHSKRSPPSSGAPSLTLEKSGGSMERLATWPVQSRLTLPMWRVRSSTVHSGHDGTRVVEPGCFGGVPEAVDVRSDRGDVDVVVHRRRLRGGPGVAPWREVRWDAPMTDLPRVRNETTLGYGAVLLVVFFWGIGPLFVRGRRRRC